VLAAFAEAAWRVSTASMHFSSSGSGSMTFGSGPLMGSWPFMAASRARHRDVQGAALVSVLTSCAALLLGPAELDGLDGKLPPMVAA
jgi:hypothetical protein